ncbi:MAG TPA: hypothetical protein VF529_13320 [Solirubrobacteraceae bacterium]|jgi:hypothetical protein
MIAAASTPAWWIVVLPVAGTLLGVAMGQFVPEWFRRRTAAEARYDAAIAPVAKMRSAHHGVQLDFPAAWVQAPTAEQHARDKHELSKQAFTRYLDAAADARSSLAALYPWSPDLRRHWDQPFIDETEFEPLMAVLFERRRAPMARFDERGRAVAGN